ncbi:hypothetical protein FC30_GL000813 [Ligilactobacillus animalis KCTC 3501 = DSM 20602]|nr:hypothetical protein FC30_GL000813 [Ligilactobacillus animalis KCTC 3501 = DSM 20602]
MLEMLYPYAEFPGTLIVTHSQEMEDGTILVHFEQPCDWGFKEARYVLPSKNNLYSEGFTEAEKKNNERILNNNANLITKYAKIGGVPLA